MSSLHCWLMCSCISLANPACEEIGCGEWKRPMIANPDYKGKWSAPMIDNPLYQGIWEPRRIPNPDFFEDNDPYNTMTPIVSGFSLMNTIIQLMFLQGSCCT